MASAERTVAALTTTRRPSEVIMPKKANTPVDPLQQALDSLVAKGLAEIIGTRKGQPVYRSTVYSQGKSTRVPSETS